MITKHDLAAAERAMDELEEASTLVPATHGPLDADPSEDRAHDPASPADIQGQTPSVLPAAPASAAVTLQQLLEDMRALHARVETDVPYAIQRTADDPYDILLALKQETGKLNDTLYALWLRHACAALKQP